MNWLPTFGGKRSAPAETNAGTGLAQLRQEMDRLFDRFVADPWNWAGTGLAADANWLPSMDLSETEKEFTVRMEIPGVDPKDLDISLVGNRLTVSGKKEEKHEKEESGYHHTESYFGSFRRTVELPAPVDSETIDAAHSNGVLTVTLKKQQTEAPKRIQVKSS